VLKSLFIFLLFFFPFSEAKQSKDELQQLLTQLEDKVKELESEKVELIEKLRLAEQAHHDNEQVQEYLEKIGEEKHVLTTEVERLRQMLEESNTERNEASTKLISLAQQLKESVQKFAEEREALTESVTLSETELAQQKEEKNRLESEIESLQAQVKEAALKIDQLENERAELAKLLAKTKDQHEEERSELVRSSSVKNLGEEAKATELEIENSKLRSVKAQLEAEIELMQKEADKNKAEHALMLAEKIKQMSLLEQKLSEAGEGVGKEEGKDKERETAEESGSQEDAGKLRNDLSEKEAELFQLRQEMYAKDKAVLEVRFL
jgi:chromosome segregation ATPase